MSIHLPFADRDEAGRLLAAALARYRGRAPLVLAIPRGAVPIGRVVADALGGELDIVQVRKLGAPWNPELAVGAVDESGRIHRAPYADELGIDAGYLEARAREERIRMRERRARWSSGAPPCRIAGRTVIVVDDGLATGCSMLAALAAVRAQQPAELVCAVPVAAADSLDRVRAQADTVVCLAAPRDFTAVGQFYRRFDAVDEAAVAALLADPHAPAAALQLTLPTGHGALAADLSCPADPWALVAFAHGSGSDRHSPRNRRVAASFHAAGLACLLPDLLSDDERRGGREPTLAECTQRLLALLALTRGDARLHSLPVVLFGSSSGAAVALATAAEDPHGIAAVISRGGRGDLFDRAYLRRVGAPVLLLVGSEDPAVLALNMPLQQVLAHAELQVIAGADHLFSTPGALAAVARHSIDWLQRQRPLPTTRGGSA